MHAYTVEPIAPATTTAPPTRPAHPNPVRWGDQPIPIERLVSARESRQARVERLREEVRSGAYRPDLKGLAEKLIENGLL